MPAYSFQPRFVEPIRAGTKGGTIRLARRQPRRGQFQRSSNRPGGHAYPDEMLALYCRQRHPGGFLIDRKKCLAVEPIELFFEGSAPTPRIAFGDPASDRRFIAGPLLDAFAVFDGFENFEDMAGFWRSTHGADIVGFAGWHIRWRELPI